MCVAAHTAGKGMELRQLRYFLAVAEEMHFHHAAERLHLSQPSLSQQIHQLEEELGVKLFDRYNRRVSLTGAGENLLRRARLILQGVEEAVQETQQVGRGLAGRLTISFVSTALIGALPPVLKDFLSRVPAAELKLEEIDPEEQILHISRGISDIGFMHASIDDPQLNSMVVQREKLMVAVPSELAGRGSVDLRSLDKYTSIMPSAFTSFGFHAHVRRAYELAGATPHKTLHTKLIIAGLYLVASGMGIAVVPESFRSVKIQGVIYRPLLVNPPPVELLAVWRRDSDSQLLQRFLETLQTRSTEKRP
jgi:DNA-binding transcriptional LysR family regulator